MSILLPKCEMPKGTILVSYKNVWILEECLDVILERLGVNQTSFKFSPAAIVPDEYIYIIDDNSILHTVVIREEEG